MNRHAEAAGVLSQALEALGSGGETAQRIPLLAKLAEAQGRSADWPAVVQASREGIPLVEAARRESAAPTCKARFWPRPSRSTAGAFAQPTSCEGPI